MTSTYDFAFSRHGLPEFCCPLPALRSEGAGNAGRPMRPIAACAMVVRDAHALVRSHRKSPGIPRAMVLTASFVISSVTGFLATVASRITPRNLTPAPGRQDHTTSPSASRALVRSTISVHRIPPRVDDVAQRPSWRDGTADDIALICVSEKQKYFCKRGWTGFGDLPCRANHVWETGCILVEFEICGAVYGPFPA